MTDTFTPPTSFPHECILDSGEKATVYGVSDFGTYLCMYKSKGNQMCGALLCENQLRDKPKVTSTWTNIYPDCASVEFSSREIADRCAVPNRIEVLRKDTVDRVTTCELEGL